MKITEKVYSKEVLESIVFYDRIDYRIIIDIDLLFKQTNRSFAELLKDLELEVNFNFSTYNKKLYFHEFIKNVCEFLKYNKEAGKQFYFFSNRLSKDDFRNSIIKKIKSIFGFQIWEETDEFENFVNKIENQDCSILPGLEIFFQQDKKPKSFKKIRKSLDKMGLTYLNEIYFEEVGNKLMIVG